jgi:hypothetical protein
MQPQPRRRPSPLLWIITTAAMLLGGAGFVTLMASMPFLIDASRDARSGLPVESASTAAIGADDLPGQRHARRRPPCAECGLIESISASRTPAGSGGREITVRLEDGSSRVIVDPNPATWRRGERVMVIDGLVGPGA